MGRASMCWNQLARVDYLCKKWRAAQNKIQKIRGRPTLLRRRPTAGDQQSPAGRRSTPGHGQPSHFFFNIYIFFDASSYTLVNFLLEVWGMGQGFWGSAQYPHFFKLPPSLGSVKSSIPHRIWGFYFF
jgi:hypothetical protein